MTIRTLWHDGDPSVLFGAASPGAELVRGGRVVDRPGQWVELAPLRVVGAAAGTAAALRRRGEVACAPAPGGEELYVVSGRLRVGSGGWRPGTSCTPRPARCTTPRRTSPPSRSSRCPSRSSSWSRRNGHGSMAPPMTCPFCGHAMHRGWVRLNGLGLSPLMSSVWWVPGDKKAGERAEAQAAVPPSHEPPVTCLLLVRCGRPRPHAAGAPRDVAVGSRSDGLGLPRVAPR